MSNAPTLTGPREVCIVYEDNQFLVLDKPGGIHSVRQENNSDYSLALWLIERDPEAGRVAIRPGDAGLVQRLDFETSGLILAAKDKESWQNLREQLMQGKIEKRYHCLLEGKLPEQEVSVSNFIGSPYRSGSKVRVYEKMPGKPHRALAASTKFSTKGVAPKSSNTLVEVTVATARRHQIRAHAAYLGHPLVGDKLYGSKSSMGVEFSSAFYLQASF